MGEINDKELAPRKSQGLPAGRHASGSRASSWPTRTTSGASPRWRSSRSTPRAGCCARWASSRRCRATTSASPSTSTSRRWPRSRCSSPWPRPRPPTTTSRPSASSPPPARRWCSTPATAACWPWRRTHLRPDRLRRRDQREDLRRPPGPGRPLPPQQPGHPGPLRPGVDVQAGDVHRRPGDGPHHAPVHGERPGHLHHRRPAHRAQERLQRGLRVREPDRRPHRVERRLLLRAGARFCPGRCRTAIQDTAKELGLGDFTEIELPFEASGRIPDEPDQEAPPRLQPRGLPRPRVVHGRQPQPGHRPGRHRRHPAAAGQRLRHPGQRRHRLRPPRRRRRSSTWTGVEVRTVEPKVNRKTEIPAAIRDPVVAGFEGAVADTRGTAAPAFAGFPLADVPDRRQDRHRPGRRASRTPPCSPPSAPPTTPGTRSRW